MATKKNKKVFLLNWRNQFWKKKKWLKTEKNTKWRRKKNRNTRRRRRRFPGMRNRNIRRRNFPGSILPTTASGRTRGTVRRKIRFTTLCHGRRWRRCRPGSPTTTMTRRRRRRRWRSARSGAGGRSRRRRRGGRREKGNWKRVGVDVDKTFFLCFGGVTEPESRSTRVGSGLACIH